MKEIVTHSSSDHCLAAVVIHTDGGRGIDSRRVSPPAVRDSPIVTMRDSLFWQDDLYISRRGRETLIVEPEGAQWVILNERFYPIFEKARMPVPVPSLLDNPFAPGAETLDFLSFLVSKNILMRKDWPLLFSPIMPSPLYYPSFFSIHVTESCNYKCSYCYVDAPSSGKVMKKSTVLEIVEKIFRDFARQDITIEFHGGEPLLARDVVKAACVRIREMQEKLSPHKCKILLQTNGSLIAAGDIEFFKDFDISVGVSMDGPPRVHDRNRVFRDGRETHDATLRGFMLLREHDINGGILAVVDDPRDYIPITEYIFSMKTMGFRLNQMVCQGRGEIDLAAATERGEQFAREFLELLDYLDGFSRAYPDADLDVWPVNIMLFHLVSTHRPFMCMRSPCGAGSHGLGFNYRGDVYPCEQLSCFDELKVGNIGERESLLEMLEESPVIRDVRSRTVENIEKCRGCPIRNFCGGGCTAEAFSVFKSLKREDIYCTFYRRTFENLMWELHKRGDLTRLMGQFGKRNKK